MEENLFIEKPLSVKGLVSIIMADIDVFLLKEDDQETDKTCVFNVEEIRNRLIETTQKVANALMVLGYELDGEIIPNPTMVRNYLQSQLS